MSSTELGQQVIQELNDTYGDEFLKFERCQEIYDTLLEEKARIEKQLNIEDDSLPIGKAVQEAETATQASDEIIAQSNEVIEEISINLCEVEDVRKQAQELFDKLNCLQTTLQYMRVVQHIEFLSGELQHELKKKDDEQCATVFANLTEISRNLDDCPAMHLRNYLKETIHYWHKILKDKLSKDFDEILKSIKWPFVNANFSLQTPSPKDIQKLQTVTEYLLQIELPSESVDPFVTSALLSDFPPLSLPMFLLVRPLRKRFLFHFHGSRQTNRPDKPEWYFTQILTWIRDHSDFIVKWIQPVIDKLGLHHIDAKLEFIRGLVQLAVEKLNADLKSQQYEDYIFSHSVDEALGFDKELRESYSYPPNQPSIMAVLTQAKVLVKWITMEKKYATEKMDEILSSTTVDPFEPLAYDIEELKVTTCADAFITLLQTITERYEGLPQPGHRLQFLDLQLELLDDFRIRLLQLVNVQKGQDVVESKIPAIANTIYYIEDVLVDWGSMLVSMFSVHFLNLYYYSTQFETANQPHNTDLDDFEAETETVFAQTLHLYRHMKKNLLLDLIDFVMAEVKSRSKPYSCQKQVSQIEIFTRPKGGHLLHIGKPCRQEHWSLMKVGSDFKGLSLSASACGIFESLAKRLHQLQKSLTLKLFTFTWKAIAQRFDAYLFEDLIMDNRFSEGGALQFKYDITRNLLPLFSQYTERPESYFTQLIESCNLLNLAKGSALLLRETLLALEDATGVEDTRGITLKEIGVQNFTPKMAVQILNRRKDITINRLDVD